MQKKKNKVAKAYKEKNPQLATKRRPPSVYPFSAIVGQDQIKLGLVLNVIDPSLGGVLIMGHRGTGKSTAVRGLADLLTDIRVVQECSFNCDPTNKDDLCFACSDRLRTESRLKGTVRPVPVVDLPLGATEDRVCGSIDIQRALTAGVKAFEPGLLARANRGFLYIDEVNLLEDHLVDLLLDVAVTGQNRVERDSMSIEHPAHFVLIGSGNPEEGDLRPQLLDRFGLFVEVQTENDVQERVEIVERRDAFDLDAEKFAASYADQQSDLRRRIGRAQRAFANVLVPKPLLRKIATLCSELKVQGHRGELTIMRAARALAAFEGRKTASEEDVRRVALMALKHRLDQDALSDKGSTARIEQALEKFFPEDAVAPNSNDSRPDREPKPNFDSSKSNGRNGSESKAGAETVDARLPSLRIGSQSRPKALPDSRNRSKAGQRAYNWQSGRYAKSTTLREPGAKLALDATLRAILAAGFGNFHDRRSISSGVLRFKQFARKRGTLFIFAIDTSGSMAQARISKARSAVLNLLKRSYVDRDSVAIVGFRGSAAETLLPPTRSILRARRVLESLSVGGGTPLAAGLARSLEVAANASIHHEGRLVVLLFTDGGANIPIHAVEQADRKSRQRIIDAEIARLGKKLRSRQVQVFVIATQNDFVSQTRTETIAELLQAKHVRLTTTEQIQTITASGLYS